MALIWVRTAARKAMFAGVPWQRCQFHLQHNAQAYVSKLDSRVPVARTIRSIVITGLSST